MEFSVSDDDLGSSEDYDPDFSDPESFRGPVERLENFMKNGHTYSRQVAARSLMETFHAVEDSADLERIMKMMMELSRDQDDVVRVELSDQLSQVGGFCYQNAHLFGASSNGHPLTIHVLPIIFRYMMDANNQVRKGSLFALADLVEQGFVSQEIITSQVGPVVSKMACSDETDDHRSEAASLICKVAPKLGVEVMKQYFLEHFLHLCNDPVFQIRKICATNFGTICEVMGQQLTETVLLEKFFHLCTDGIWGVRKACAECFNQVSRVCSPAVRHSHLSRVFINLITDQSRWVRMAAFEVLGAFISTFANPTLTGLRLSDDGSQVIFEPSIVQTVPSSDSKLERSPESSDDSDQTPSIPSTVPTNGGLHLPPIPTLKRRELDRLRTPSLRLLNDIEQGASVDQELSNNAEFHHSNALSDSLILGLNYANNCVDNGSHDGIITAAVDSENGLAERDLTGDHSGNRVGRGSAPASGESVEFGSSSYWRLLVPQLDSDLSNRPVEISAEVVQRCIENCISADISLSMDTEAETGADNENLNSRLKNSILHLCGKTSRDATEADCVGVDASEGEEKTGTQDEDRSKEHTNSHDALLIAENLESVEQDSSVLDCPVGSEDKGGAETDGVVSGSVSLEAVPPAEVLFAGHLVSRVIGDLETEEIPLNSDNNLNVNRESNDTEISHELPKKSLNCSATDLLNSSSRSADDFLNNSVNDSLNKLASNSSGDSSNDSLSESTTESGDSSDEYITTDAMMETSPIRDGPAADEEEEEYKQNGVEVSEEEVMQLVAAANELPRDDIAVYEQNVVPRDLLEQYVSMMDPVCAQGVDSEIMRHCAYSLPAVAYTLGRKNWPSLKNLYSTLASDVQWKVRRTLAFSIHELATIVGEEITSQDLVPIFDGFLSDLDEVRIGVLKHLADFLKLLSGDVRRGYLIKVTELLKTDNSRNWRFREELARQLEHLVDLFSVEDIEEHITPIALSLAHDRVALIRLASLKVMTGILRRMVEEEETRGVRKEDGRTWLGFLARIKEEFGSSRMSAQRQMFIQFCSYALQDRVLDEETFAAELLPGLLLLHSDPVPNVRITLARTVANHLMHSAYFSSERNVLCTELELALTALRQDKDRDVRYLLRDRKPADQLTEAPSSSPTMLA